MNDPSLFRSLTLHEPALISVLPPQTEEGKAAREDRQTFVRPPIVAAAKAGDTVQAVRLFFEGVYQLGPGGFDRLPQTTKTMILDNARTAPLLFGSPASSAITCDVLRTFNRPTLVTHGEKTHVYYKLINDGVIRCVPGARQVAFPNLVHAAASRDPMLFHGVTRTTPSPRSSMPFRSILIVVKRMLNSRAPRLMQVGLTRASQTVKGLFG